ncbi:hypothetical protein C0991_008491 [Blastosporella zonata]|nr:hypothetical protein C0991_008491 [Blastosporella zonata]
MHNWRHAEDLEAFEHVTREAATILVGKNCDPDLQDDVREERYAIIIFADAFSQLIAFWEVSMPPARMLRVAQTHALLMHRIPLTDDALASITQPVLLVHGELNENCPRKFAEQLASKLVNAEGGAFAYTIKGARGSLGVVPQHASILHKVFADFLGRLPHRGSTLTPPESDRTGRMRAALGALAEVMGDPKVASRDPTSSLSFCCRPQAVIHRQTEALKQYRRGIFTAFSPLGPDGRPARKYSDRRAEHWFTSETNGLSIAGNNIFLPAEQSRENEKKPLSPQPAESRLRRANYSSTAVEKPVIKGSMARVVASTAPSSQLKLIV